MTFARLLVSFIFRSFSVIFLKFIVSVTSVISSFSTWKSAFPSFATNSPSFITSTTLKSSKLSTTIKSASYPGAIAPEFFIP